MQTLLARIDCITINLKIASFRESNCVFQDDKKMYCTDPVS